MNEKLLQFIWQFQYFNRTSVTTASGELIQIFNPGKLNKDQGPDFTNAKIKIGDTLLAGSVELHIKTSDWDRHGHQHDNNYNNVILHVVFEHDQKIENRFPVLELQPHISTILLEHYNNLMNAQTFIACTSSIHQVKDITWQSWKERLLVERLSRKSLYVLQLLKQSNFHWEETFWWLLAKNFGIKINADAFEAIARSISVNILSKHKHQIQQLEALLLGQAQLLNEEFLEEYPKLLQREYNFLQKKYSLSPVHHQILFLRMRPHSFPTIRLAQLAALIYTSAHLFSKIVEAEKLSDIRHLFAVTANDYWHYHFTFSQASAFQPKTLGQQMIDNILINTVIPVVFSYGAHHNDDKYKQKAISWMEELPAERNVITKGFVELLIGSRSAFDSQALIELKNEYCNHKKCLECAVGNFLLKNETSPMIKT